MPFGISKTLAGILFLSVYAFVGSTASFAQCPVLNVMVKGEVQGRPRGGLVRVQLVYSKHSVENPLLGLRQQAWGQVGLWV
jgi:hypothetical protein